MTADSSVAADTLRDELLALEVDKYPLFTEYQIDQIMPGVLQFADAQVAAEQERIAAAIEDEARARVDEQPLASPSVSRAHAYMRAARIARGQP